MAQLDRGFFQLGMTPARHLASSAMKRDHATLLNDRAAQEEDARLRRTLEAADVAEQRAERVAATHTAQAACYRKNMKKWDSSNVMLATDFVLSDPKQIPVGS